MSEHAIDKATGIRNGEDFPVDAVLDFLKGITGKEEKIVAVKQFPSGFSNLTYLIETEAQEYVLRRPPIGANIKSAHDMGREFNVLSLLRPIYPYVPSPIAYEETGEVLGAPFYLMERVKGIILRNQAPTGINLNPELMNTISLASVNHLAGLHQLDLKSSGLAEFGKPDGYVERQISGWSKRYQKAKTDDIPDMEYAFDWLKVNMPEEIVPSFLHNDFKYDNLVLDQKDPGKVKAVLDWEMATVGDPLMDLGTTLAYWAEPKDNDALKPFNLTWLPGNLNREEVVQNYFDARDIPSQNMVFYYVYGAAKVGVICQQIYARYKMGITKDPRFKMLIYVTKACANNAKMAIQLNRISNLY